MAKKMEKNATKNDPFDIDIDLTDDDIVSELDDDEVIDISFDDPIENAANADLAKLMSGYDAEAVALAAETDSTLYIPIDSGMYIAEVTNMFLDPNFTGEENQPLIRLTFKILKSDSEENRQFVGVETSKSYFVNSFERREDRNGKMREAVFFMDMFYIGRGKLNIKSLSKEANMKQVVGKRFRVKSQRKDENRCNFYIQKAN